MNKDETGELLTRYTLQTPAILPAYSLGTGMATGVHTDNEARIAVSVIFRGLASRVTLLRISFIILFLQTGYGLYGQTFADSLTIASAGWKQQTLKEGVVWRSAHIDDLFQSKQTIQVLEADLDNPGVRVAFAGVSSGLQFTSVFAREAGATAAVNASFFNMKEGGSVTFLRIDNLVINETVGQGGSQTSGALTLKDGREAAILPIPEAGKAEQLGLPNVMVSGPLLLDQGKTVSLDSNAFNRNRHPRTAVALTAGNKLLLITVDGRNARAQGMSLPELAYFLRTYGARYALNLDGGGSTTMYIQGQPDNGVVNFPSDNRQFDHDGERKVASVILVF